MECKELPSTCCLESLGLIWACSILGRGCYGSVLQIHNPVESSTRTLRISPGSLSVSYFEKR